MEEIGVFCGGGIDRPMHSRHFHKISVLPFLLCAQGGSHARDEYSNLKAFGEYGAVQRGDEGGGDGASAEKGVVTSATSSGGIAIGNNFVKVGVVVATSSDCVRL